MADEEIITQVSYVRQQIRQDTYYCHSTLEGTRTMSLRTTRTDEVDQWFNFSLSTTNPYILRVYLLNIIGDKIDIISEPFNCTLASWMGYLVTTQDGEFLHETFIQIILYIMQGIIFLHDNLRQVHGNICLENAFIVNNRAKLGNVIDRKISRSDDYDSFTKMVRDYFTQKGITLPFAMIIFYVWSNTIELDRVYDHE